MLKKIAFTIVPAMAAFMFLCPAADAQSVVDWNQGVIIAVGQGTAEPSGNRGRDRLMAERAAQVHAYRELLEVTKGVHVDSSTTVENMMVKEDVVKARVEGIVKGAQVVKKKTEWDNATPLATVEVRLCLNNTNCTGSSLVSSLNLDQNPGPPNTPAKPFVFEPAGTAVPLAPKGPKYSYDSQKKVTGVIFNLEGRPFEKVLLPVVVTGKDNEMMTVYSVKSVKPNVIRTYGVVRYADNVDNGRKIEYLGDNVLVIAIDQVTKENFILVDKDAARLLKETTAHDNDYTSDAKVVISAN